MGLPPEASDSFEVALRDRAWATAVVTRSKGSAERTIVLGQCVESIEPGRPGDDELLARAGIGGCWKPVRVALCVLQTGTARLQEVVDVLAAKPETAFRAVRTLLALRAR